jgi:hypothetical protein
VIAFTPQNLTNDGDGNPYRLHRARRSWKSVLFGFQIGSAHPFREECGFLATAEETTWTDACDSFFQKAFTSELDDSELGIKFDLRPAQMKS